MPTRFSLRTLILMVLALVTFVWFYRSTHRAPRRAPVRAVEVVLPASADGGQGGDG